MMNHEEAFTLARRRDANNAARDGFIGRYPVLTPARLGEWEALCAEAESIAAQWRRGMSGR